MKPDPLRYAMTTSLSTGQQGPMCATKKNSDGEIRDYFGNERKQIIPFAHALQP